MWEREAGHMHRPPFHHPAQTTMLCVNKRAPAKKKLPTEPLRKSNAGRCMWSAQSESSALWERCTDVRR